MTASKQANVTPERVARTTNLMTTVSQDRYGGPEVLKLKPAAKPIPKDNEILVRVYAAPVTAAGTFMREGSPYIGRLFMGLFKPKFDIPGTGFSGEVEAVGSTVQKFKEGDQVFGEKIFAQGTFSQYITLPEDDVIFIKPKNVTHAEAAPVTDGHLTSLNFLQNVVQLKPGQRILIVGASGSLGSAAVQLAAHRGAHVTGVCSSKNVEWVKNLGAHAVIDYTKEDFTKTSTPYDVIYDTLGKSSFRACKPVLSRRGVYMSPVLDFGLLLQVLWTSFIGKKKARFSATGMVPKPQLNTMMKTLAQLIAEGKLITVIDRKYPMEQIVEASAYVDSGRKKGNVVITME